MDSTSVRIRKAGIACAEDRHTKKFTKSQGLTACFNEPLEDTTTEDGSPALKACPLGADKASKAGRASTLPKTHI
jgi:hypothetical protein